MELFVMVRESNAPFFFPSLCIHDSMPPTTSTTTGLSDAYDNSLMGMCAELIASDMGLTRESQVCLFFFSFFFFFFFLFSFFFSPFYFAG
jgi:hypothetical protein